MLFVTARSNDALSVWRINAEAGTLSQAEVYRDGEDGIDGLERAQGVAVSGDLLFVTAQIDSALSVWRINAEAETGILRQTALHRDSVLFRALQVGVSGDVLFVSGQQNAGTISVWHINNAELPFGEPLTVRVQSDTPVLRQVEVTVTARSGADTATAEPVTLSPENLSVEAIFAADDLVPGRWIFTAEAEPSTLLDTSAARIAVQVLAPVQLTLDVPPSVTVGDTLTVTVGVAAETPLPEGVSVTATLSFSADGVDDRVVTLTSGALCGKGNLHCAGHRGHRSSGSERPRGDRYFRFGNRRAGGGDAAAERSKRSDRGADIPGDGGHEYAGARGHHAGGDGER